jgi:hypothetical protein
MGFASAFARRATADKAFYPSYELFPLLSTETLQYCFRVLAHGLVGKANEDRDSDD